jgi:hypothetical protein
MLCGPARGQVIEFESNGLKYQTLTKSGVTIIFARMNTHLKEYYTIQVAISNGSAAPYVVRPEDFNWVRTSGAPVRASPARDVVEVLREKGSGSDVVKLVTAYEAAIYGNTHMQSTNGYEQRRQAAIAMGGGARIRAAATASALAFVQTKLAPGESTDGAVFFNTETKALGPGHLVVKTNTDTFDFLSTSEQ